MKIPLQMAAMVCAALLGAVLLSKGLTQMAHMHQLPGLPLR